ncbi:amino acid ABC transporter permease [Paralcaligenes ureilyticus]|uniref:L-glutamate ABC transporter membrane protein /L-aspartate ABC transporter membrane protein n=1 Tax=Paralcaligenes ureilyticus TaxID=627131 RepID=A0A4R3M6Z1_9BURK|nr:amino acid ABC transporter permease [Paralcaligenes ureilyticus]TCT07337.1 L-glutamate ABC transporter membrane protein /L-aspartate ABC transporter membrane protein [Paralcaligenes ureilyticus]
MSYKWDWGVFLEHASKNQTYLDWMLSGFEVTLMLGLSAWLIALVVGTSLGVMRTLPNRACRAIGAAYVELFRNVPLLVQFFIWYFAVPELMPYGEQFKQLPPFVQQFLAAMICLGVFTAARVCEQVRSGINALPRGQKNAGLANGLTLLQTYRYVLLPVSFRIVLPPITSEFLNIFKNSAIASTIGLMELAAQGRQLVDYTAHSYESFMAVTLLYALISLCVMAIMWRIERLCYIPGLSFRK